MTLPPLIQDDFFDRVLIEPSTARNCDELLIVSGYASSAILSKHAESLAGDVTIRLFVGMTQSDGVRRSDHERFRSLQGQRPGGGRIECKYGVDTNTHSKVYVWLKNGSPVESWIGSANYTFNGFGMAWKSNREVLSPTCPETAKKYADYVMSAGVDCTDNDIESHVKITDVEHDSKYVMHAGREPWDDIPGVELSILTRQNEAHNPGAGLNWGLRENRDPDEAYIHVPANSEPGRYLPPNGTHFTVLTDDDNYMTLKRGGQGGKNLTSPESNSILGRYLRGRLGLPNGTQVKKEHIFAYGRSTLSFHQLREDLYYMDFSKPRKRDVSGRP